MNQHSPEAQHCGNLAQHWSQPVYQPCNPAPQLLAREQLPRASEACLGAVLPTRVRCTAPRVSCTARSCELFCPPPA